MGPSREVLVELYETGMSYEDIGREYGVTRTSVKRWFKARDIPPRSLSEARVIAAKKHPNTEKQRESARHQAAMARAALTPKSYEKMVATRRKKGVNYQSGENSHSWQGGVTKLYASPRTLWKSRRMECYRRDGWTCQDCKRQCDTTKHGKSIDGGLMVQAHHIVPRRHGGNDDLENLVTLCLSCHRKRETRHMNALFA